jgi:NADPH2:quinone reductase
VTGAAGGVGSAIADLANAQGITVIGSVSSVSKAAFAHAAGAQHVINYRTEKLLERVREITDGRGVDACFDHVIGPGFIDCLHMLANFGTAVAYNVFSPMPGKDVYGELRELSTRSLGLRVFNMHSFDHDRPALRRLTAELIQLLANRKITPRIGARLPLAQAAEAHRLMESGEVLGKIILTA